MSDWKAKRFWTQADVQEAEGGFVVKLDTRVLRTPAKAELILPTQEMAVEIAAEWQAQTDDIKPLTMPLTRAANAAIDKVAVQFDEVANMLAAYGDSDLLCYRAESPVELAARQSARWDPLLDWAEATFDARLATHVGLIHVPQDGRALGRLAGAVHRQTEFQLAAFHDLVSISGSLVIALAAANDYAPADALWQTSRVDEDWQEEHWGEDDEASALSAQKKGAFLSAKRFFDLA